MKYIGLLGRLPALSQAELASLLSPNQLGALDDHHLGLKVKPPVQRLGGLVKLWRVLDDQPAWAAVLRATVDFNQQAPPGKLRLGLSSHSGLTLADLKSIGFKLKRQLQGAGRNVRLVLPGPDGRLGSAQVLFNKLLENKGREFCWVTLGNKVYLTQTVWEQDIRAYAARDHQRPARDARRGMLPPKLAQIMINLASRGQPGQVLDPCCGTGVVLQEAILMGHPVQGGDIETRMVAASRRNLGLKTSLRQADARLATYTPTPDFVVSELDLGPPLKKPVTKARWHQLRAELGDLHGQILSNLARQLPQTSRLCVALPQWRSQDNTWLPAATLAELPRLGWQLEQKLDYYRPDQFVGRQLLVLTARNQA